MNELDDAWSEMLANAIADARSSGRADVADYLALKQTNDGLRQAGVDWLFGMIIEIASEASRGNPAVTIEREEPHEFPFNNATMAGSLIRIRFGVRSMIVEAGWTRLPSHGFMRGGALAAARIKHFGVPKANVELILVRNEDVPAWTDLNGGKFDSKSLLTHFATLLESR